MGADPLSPIAPARVRALLLPIGRIKRARFLSFIDRLQPEHVVLLGDISPDGRPNRNMFSPLAFPTGKIIYDLTTALPPPSHLCLSPLELHRQPLLVIGIADGAELGHESRHDNKQVNGKRSSMYATEIRALDQELENLRDVYPRAIVHQLLLFDYVPGPTLPSLPEGLVSIPSPKTSGITTMKTVMCDLSSMLLAEMTTTAKSFQGMSAIESLQQGRAAQPNGYSWGGEENAPSRRASHFGTDSRSTSVGSAGKVDRSAVRMSMPAQLRTNSDSSRSNSISRPTTPQRQNSHDLAEIKSPESSALSRAQKVDAFRDHSRDRISVQGFGSGSSSEQFRSKGKGRIAIIIGSLYLQAGRWGDALRELSEGCTIAKSVGDHLWHAKALDHIIVGMLMLAWARLDFQIPQVCFAIADKPGTSTPTGTPERSQLSNRLYSLKALGEMLPELLSRILHLYERSSNRAGEALPQIAFSDSAVRFAKLLTAMHMTDGVLNDDLLDHLVSGKPLMDLPATVRPLFPTKAVIVATLFRAFPSVTAEDPDLTVADRATILAGIASVLGELGYHRKKAMIMREFVAIIIPGLIQARVIGAAEAGIHPAAGISALKGANGEGIVTTGLDEPGGNLDAGMNGVLALIGRVYGVIASDPGRDFDDSNEAVIKRIMQAANLRAFGGQNMKMNVLRACINLVEALPDFHGILRFTADLLRTAGRGIAPGPASDDASPSMVREEQVRLMEAIVKTGSVGKKLGFEHLEAEYWDEFLVRKIELEPLVASRAPVPYNAAELGGSAVVSESKERNPFIYNPFLRRTDAVATNRLLIAGESADFRVTLQNPYEFDVEVESIRLESHGIEFDSAVQNTLIGPYRTQILTVSGIPGSEGALSITGCIIKIRGCRERRFPIFVDPWTPRSETKIKATGLSVTDKERLILDPTEAQMRMFPELVQPRASTIDLTIIKKQPILVIKSGTLSQSALMVLEGEKQQFSITLENLSDTAADLLVFSFQDSTQGPLQTALSNRDASPAELYEYELNLSQRQALRWVNDGKDSPYVGPGATATFTFEILGKPGLTHCAIQVDYASLEVPLAQIKEKIFTRQVTQVLTVTVNASVELARMDILPLSDDISVHPWSDKSTENDYSISPDTHCLMLLDLRNAWPSILNIHLDIGIGRSLNEDILPGNTSRLLFPIPRTFLDDPYAPIPALDVSRQRQFVVSSGRISADAERSTREAFWYRESVLKLLRGTWKASTGLERSGSIELRGIRLGPRMVEAIRIEGLGIELSLSGPGISREEAGSKSHVETVALDTALMLRVKVNNRTNQGIRPLLRIQPSLRNRGEILSIDVSKRMAWDGVLQMVLEPIPARGTTTVETGVTFLSRGIYEMSASIEEVVLESSSKIATVDRKAADKGARARANTREMMDAVLGAAERKCWHVRSPLVVVVCDDNDEDEDDEEETSVDDRM